MIYVSTNVEDMQMKVLIFGATGGIGKWVVKHAKEKGYSVSVYVRDAGKMNDSLLHVIEGELNDYGKMRDAVKGQDAVIWTVGIPMKRKYNSMAALEGHKNLLRAMKESGVNRLIDWGTPSIHSDEDVKSFITVIPGIAAYFLFKQAKEEMVAIGELLKSSDLDWTMVRFMAPKDSTFIGKVKVGFGDIKMNFNISREDIANFMVDQVEDKTYMKSMPIIGS
jgi:putative NADH-flavin reductase